MSDSKFVSGLTRLLTDPSLRERLRVSPEEVAKEIGSEALSWDCDELDRQAEGLVRKRFHEVNKLAPRTVRMLAGDALEEFRKYAERHWPDGHDRHSNDAIEFLLHLVAKGERKVSRMELGILRQRKSRLPLSAILVLRRPGIEYGGLLVRVMAGRRTKHFCLRIAL